MPILRDARDLAIADFGLGIVLSRFLNWLRRPSAAILANSLCMGLSVTTHSPDGKRSTTSGFS
jgi:hypothetical protein